MNIITKIKNWIIKKLGGYTEEEYGDVCCQRDVWKKLHDTGENHLRIVENAAKYWCDEYITEHAAYLASLNCHNATAEAAQNGTAGVSGAIDTIKAYCDGKDGCDNCALYDASKGCKLAMCPCYWEAE